MGRKKKDALVQFNKGNILDAAKSLFESKGVAATTMDDIAKEADCSKSTMYVYFKSKDDILNHVILEQMIGLRDMIRTCVSKGHGFVECYHMICDELVTFQETHPVYYEILLGEIKVTKEEIEGHTVLGQIYEAGEEVNDAIEEILKKGISQKKIRDDIQIIPTVFYLWSGISQIIGFAQKKEQYFMFRLGMTKKEYMEYAFELLIQSILSKEA